MTRKPLLGVTMGDAAGTGPEIVAKAWALPEIKEGMALVVIGDAAVMRAALSITHVAGRINAVQDIAEAQFAPDALDVLDLHNIDLSRLQRGQVNPMAGQAAYQCIAKAVELAMAGQIDAIVTSAIHKEALNEAGYHYAGHTEVLAELTGTPSVTMMLTGGNMRVSHVSTHCSMREAIERVKEERVLAVIRLTDQALKRMGLPNARIAVAGLNPHSGEGGLFGTEETEEIQPAVDAARAEGINVDERIFPPDTVFYRMNLGEFDAVVAMYHDQGHIPLKLIAFDEGVNVTLGLPIIRTSVDHGTAFGKAGKGTARIGSMVAALRLAAQMVRSD